MFSRPPATVAPELSGLLALVADGNRAGNRDVRRVLASLGVSRVIEVEDGAEVLGVFAERRPDLLVLDWRQSVVAATEIIACLRDEARSHAPGVPIVVTMSDPTRRTVEAAVALQVNAIVAKPYSAASLRVRVAVVLPSGSPE